MHGDLGCLVPRERLELARWLAQAATAGIDAVQDLAHRPWLEERVDAILGVFRDGQLHASWLLVCHAGRWSVASCAEDTVSPACASLSEALARVHRAR
jgi:hypothetical protein